MLTPDDLSLMDDKEKLDLLRRLAESDEWQESFEPLYRRLMDDPEPKVRQEAIAALWDLADPRHIEPLMQKAESDPDAGVRAKAASVLGIFIFEAVAHGVIEEAQFLAVRGQLLDLAQNPREEMEVRRMAIEALSFDLDDVIADLIEWAYKQPAVEMRMSAIFSMGRSRSPRWTDVILSELDSKEPKLQMEAVNACAEASLTTATPKLRLLAGSKEREVRLAAIWALARTRGPGAIETLEMCGQSSDEETRAAANEAIEEYYLAEEEDAQNPDFDESDDSDYDPDH